MKKFNKVSTAVAVACVLGLIIPIAALAASPSTVNLGTAGNFVILAKTGISTTGATSVIGDIGVSPAQATYITGFSLILPAASAFSTSALITGKVYAPGYADPTPANLTTAIGDMQTAYTDAAGRSLNAITELGAGNIGGMTLAPGLYKWGTGVTIPTDVTLSGGANDVWIFQIAQGLTVSSATKVNLSGGAQASNVFWAVAGATTIGTGAVFNGNILDQTNIALNTGATLNGRALAQSAVTLQANAVTIPTVTAPAIPAIPATPAIPAVPASSSSNGNGSSNSATPAVPATPATPAIPGCPVGFHCVLTPVVAHTPLVGCPVGFNCVLTSGIVNGNLPSASAFGQQVKTIVTSLGQGNSNNNVKILQQFLISQNKGSAAQALAKVGTTSYFGALTRAALAEFQASVGISPALGNFGSITRAYLSAHY